MKLGTKAGIRRAIGALYDRNHEELIRFDVQMAVAEARAETSGVDLWWLLEPIGFSAPVHLAPWECPV